MCINRVLTKKECSKCLKSKPHTDFHKNSASSDGLMARCKDCRKIDTARYYNTPEVRQRQVAYMRNYHNKNKEQNVNQSRIYRAKEDNKTKIKARYYADRAYRLGVIKRPRYCKICHRDANLEKHHIDYNRCLDIYWLCRKCHRRVHSAVHELILIAKSA